MREVIVGIPRIEGRLQLRQTTSGRIHLAGGPQPANPERLSSMKAEISKEQLK